MKKIYIKTACLYSCIVAIQLYGIAGRDQTTNSQVLSCNGTNVTCNYAINAVGDQKDIRLKTTKIDPQNQLGKIKTAKTIEFELPKTDAQKLFTLTLAEPFSDKSLDIAIANVPMEVLFVTSIPDTESLKLMPKAIAMVKAYRRLRGKGPQNEKLWNERSTLLFDTSVTNLLPLKLTINPNGVVQFTNPDGTQGAIYLGEA